MKLSHLEISNFRNLIQVSIDLSHDVNLFYGANGSGKTSLLEAIHYLGLGRSFRTRYINRIIHQEADQFSLFAQLSDGGGILPVGLERKRHSPNPQIKIAGNVGHSLLELAQMLPLQLIHADSHLLLSSGPLSRRQFLDWGVFHVEPSFYHFWQRVNRIIKQRNASLKSVRAYSEIALWDDELTTSAEKLHAMRLNYQQLLASILQNLLETFLGHYAFTLQYNPGWDVDKGLNVVLQNSFERDKQLGYTQYGPHRADLQLKIQSIAAQDRLSQGQQKLAAYALRLAQGNLFMQQTDKTCLYLIDDLPSELDPEKRLLISQQIKALKAPIIITGIEKNSLEDFLGDKTRVFHVEHGEIHQEQHI